MKLSTIDPATLARSVGDAMLQHVQRLALPLSPGATLSLDGGVVERDGALRRLPADPASVGLALTAADLCRFAQTGDTADWGDASGALDAAQELYATLCARPVDLLERDGSADPEDSGRPWWADVTADTALGVVLQAGLARAWAVTGLCGIPTAWLAALAEVTPGRVRQLVTGGELRVTTERDGSATRALVEPEDARRWLTVQGVAGFRAGTPQK